MRLRRQHAARAIQDVAPLDAHRPHVDQQAVRLAHRIGHLLVAKNLRPAGLEIHRRLHRRPCYPTRAGETDSAPPDWWETVEDRVERLVFACVPGTAHDLDISLDAVPLEIVVAYTVRPRSADANGRS